MVSEDFSELSRRRSARAIHLAKLHPASAEALIFVSNLAPLQEHIGQQARQKEDLLAFHQPLVELIQATGTDLLRNTAARQDHSSFERAIEDYLNLVDTSSPTSFLARVVLQPFLYCQATGFNSVPSGNCPRCRQPPQVAVLHPQGHGKAISLVCSLCLSQWRFSRVCCAACGEQNHDKLEYFQSNEFEQITVHCCTSCNKYIHCMDAGIDPLAVPDIDELVALPLDVWAQKRGLRKIQVNLAGF